MWGTFEALLRHYCPVCCRRQAKVSHDCFVSVAPLSSVPCWEKVYFLFTFPSMPDSGWIPSSNKGLYTGEGGSRMFVHGPTMRWGPHFIYSCSTYGYSLRTNPRTTQLTASSFCLNNRGRDPRGQTCAICHNVGDVFQRQMRTENHLFSLKAAKLRISQIHH